MSEKKRVSLYQEQKKTKPKVEDVINELLKGDRKQAALDFVSFIKSLKMTPQWASANSWAVSYKNKRVCYIKIKDFRSKENYWYIRPAIGYDDETIAFCERENLKQIMINSIHFCQGCGKCAPGKRMIFFGKEFENVCCSSIDFEFHNPDAATLECAKKLVDFRRSIISGKER